MQKMTGTARRGAWLCLPCAALAACRAGGEWWKDIQKAPSAEEARPLTPEEEWQKAEEEREREEDERKAAAVDVMRKRKAAQRKARLEAAEREEQAQLAAMRAAQAKKEL